MLARIKLTRSINELGDYLVTGVTILIASYLVKRTASYIVDVIVQTLYINSLLNLKFYWRKLEE